MATRSAHWLAGWAWSIGRPSRQKCQISRLFHEEIKIVRYLSSGFGGFFGAQSSTTEIVLLLMGLFRRLNQQPVVAAATSPSISAFSSGN